MYEYQFNPNNCWYKKVCQNTCESSCIRYMEMDFLLYRSQIPTKRQYPVSLTPESVDYDRFMDLADIKDDINNFVNNGESLYITSEFTGNGKTSWAIKLMLKYFDNIWSGNGFKVRGIFVNVPSFLTQLKSNISNHNTEFENTIDSLSDVDLVIWDDIASTGLTAYEHSQLLSYIDQRVLACKANIFTGNIPDEKQLEKAIGTRLASRVLSGTVIELKGRDRRLNGSVANFK